MKIFPFARISALFLAFGMLLVVAPLWLSTAKANEAILDEPPPVSIDVNTVPSDAVVLIGFGGGDAINLDSFVGGETWHVSDEAVTTFGKSPFAESKQEFGDCQLHLQFMTPSGDRDQGQFRGNSGIYFMGLYEVQILDTFENKTYADGQCGAIYRQHPPLVNACRPAGQWQTYDIAFTAPRFDGDRLVSPAYVTAFLNGVLVQNHSKLIGPTDGRGEVPFQTHSARLPLRLQNHGDMVKFRSVWIRDLDTNSAPDNGTTESEAAAAPGSSGSDTSAWRPLLDEKLTQWETFLGAPHPSVAGLPSGIPTSENFKKGAPLGVNNDVLGVFKTEMVDGEPVLRISGEVYGALTSKEEFENYHLKMQFKWGKQKYEPRLKSLRDSGLLFHCFGPHGANGNSWMECLECQIQERDYGDLFCLGDTSAVVTVSEESLSKPRAQYSPAGTPKRLKIARRGKDHGRPTDWNTLELLTVGNAAEYRINGKTANVISNARRGQADDGPVLNRGKLQIQSEGATLYVRRLEIKPLTAIPSR